ncbi:MAG TPA: hypothetical protein VMO17_19810 [Terriglobia bacterium]|nr:hypothetical protein [Terriglobia bacterium]
MRRSHNSGPKPDDKPPAAGPPAPPAAAREFRAADFAVIRLEDFQEIARLEADLVSVYTPVNSQERIALRRMALAQQAIFRAYRLEAGLCASAMNEFCDGRGDLTLIMNAQFVGDGDIEITQGQNRNMAFAEGFQRMVARSDVWTVFLRYQAQAERNYRRALEEFERLRALRPELAPNQPVPQAPREEELSAVPSPGHKRVRRRRQSPAARSAVYTTPLSPAGTRAPSPFEAPT